MITNYFFFFLFYQGFSLTATYDKDLSNGNGGVILNYTEFGSDSGITFSHFIMKRIYDQVPEWNPISAMNFVKGDKVKVLNYYPVADFVDEWHQMKYVDFTYTDGSPAKSNHLKSDSMKVWMEGGTIGGEVYEPVGEIEIDGTKEKLLYVDSEPMTSFNTNPQKIFDYDVIVFGTWDTNYADYDMSKRTNLPIPASIEVLKNYLDQGFGVLFGHDTLGFVFGKKDSFGPLQDYVKLKFGRWGSYPASADNRDYDEVSQFWTVQTVIKKEGLLTKYPWDIGPIGTVLNISLTHTCAQTAFGDIWLEMGELYHDPIDGPYSDIAAPEEVGGNYKFYLTSHKNAAMMQTGHSNCESTHDERKIIANTLFYLKQRSSATSLIDNEAYDREPPGKPELKSLTFSND
ncbi:hypothetical protein TRFO_37253 [Tritrichomonas foetus]|uniref:ThuA-like domain-containing protein n=1 Tax=Tritrichomonas foetus TaxID=1144522 RepID=A0A1J4JGJ0_9EUKA|nr:hypothetical protein TRFO_37253 [Tritrichomonas foetus]|eukprot:OHS96573.1 hypothetical protein TRFO_37253 [Tritrichomonas foetus]